MRIVGGKYKGRKLYEFSLEGVRPTSDMTRESFFNIIKDGIEDSVFLDLFSGTGAMGIEALSRGAKKVFFNDLSRDSVNVIKKNLSLLGEINGAKITNLSAADFLKTTTEKFDYIYLDPPYSSDLGKEALSLIPSVLSENGIVVFEREKPFTEKIDGLYLFDERRYGRATLSFFKLQKPCAVFAGTFDPVTVGHEKVILKALKKYGRVLVVMGENPQKIPHFSAADRLILLKETFKKERGVEIYDYKAIDNYSEFLKKEKATTYVRGIRDEKDMAYEKAYEEKNREIYPFVTTEYVTAEEFSAVSSGEVRKKLLKGEDVSAFIPEKARKAFKKIIKKAKQ